MLGHIAVIQAQVVFVFRRFSFEPLFGNTDYSLEVLTVLSSILILMMRAIH